MINISINIKLEKLQVCAWVPECPGKDGLPHKSRRAEWSPMTSPLPLAVQIVSFLRRHEGWDIV